MILASPTNPKCPANNPTKSTNVTPKDMPKSFCFAQYTPAAITKAYNNTVCATDEGVNSRFSIQVMINIKCIN